MFSMYFKFILSLHPQSSAPIISQLKINNAATQIRKGSQKLLP